MNTETPTIVLDQDAREAIALMCFELGRSKEFQATYEEHMDTYGGLVGVLERASHFATALDTQVKAKGVQWGVDLEWYDAMDDLVYRFVTDPTRDPAHAAAHAIDYVIAKDKLALEQA